MFAAFSHPARKEFSMITTYEVGSSENPSILFLHGGGLSSKSWLPVIERLPDFHCLAPDLPGHGHSKDLPFTIEDSARAAAEVIRLRAPGQKAHLVALSIGGPVAFTLLRTCPEMVGSVVLSGSSGKVSPWVVRLSNSLLWIYKLFPLDKLVRMSIKQHGVPPQYEALVLEDMLAGADLKFFAGLTREMARWSLPQRIQSPLLLAVGEKEPSAARSFTRAYLRQFPQARGVIVPEARHGWPLQFPDLFAGMVRAWVTGQPLPETLKPFEQGTRR
jgi:pimeloyl-ACP methyl ester carboxylesterase